jgi:hypothetical protein
MQNSFLTKINVEKNLNQWNLYSLNDIIHTSILIL